MKRREDEADELDLAMFRCSEAMRRFGDVVGNHEIMKAGKRLAQARAAVRQYMNPVKREETENN